MTALLIAWLSLAAAATGPGGSDVVESKLHPGLAQLQQAGSPSPVWVFFADKGVPAKRMAAALDSARRSLHPRTLARRTLRRSAAGLVDAHDLPLHEPYVERVAGCAARLRVRSRWLNAVSVEVDAAQLQCLARLPFVRAITPVRRGVPARDIPVEVVVAGLQPAPYPEGLGGSGYGASEEQLLQIGIKDMHEAGYTGTGLVIGVLDTGFKRTHVAFNHPIKPIEVLAEWDFINGDGNTAPDPGDSANQHHHGTLILGTLAGYAPGEYIGGAHDASFILAKTEDTTDEYPAEEDFYVAGLEFVESNGADMATSSLGYIDWYTYADLDGQTAVTTTAVNIATANGMLCCTAAGNGGHDGDLPSLLAPGDALQVLTCGAVDIEGNLAGFSANGPTFDGRVKPELLARGVATATVSSSDDDVYTAANGTSLSTPLVAAAAALLIQAHPEWSVEQLRAALLETADYYAAHGEPDPQSLLGYGIVDVFAAAQLQGCSAAADCADTDGDGLRDDGCVWWSCTAGSCVGVDVVFADLGGEYGACEPDGVADGNDRFHVLNCFANTDTIGHSGYPCEAAAPQAYNVDPGGSFGDCQPDGVCDGNDAFHVLNAFEGATSCSCARDGGPAPQPPTDPPLQQHARIVLQAEQRVLQPGDLLNVDVLLVSALADLRGYQLHLGVSGGRSGKLDLVDIAIRESSVFRVGKRLDDNSKTPLAEPRATSPSTRPAALLRLRGERLQESRTTSHERRITQWSAFNVATRQMLAGLDGPGVLAPRGAYLATFTYRVSGDAAGMFEVELLHDDSAPAQRTFLFTTPAGGGVEIDSEPARIEVLSVSKAN